MRAAVLVALIGCSYNPPRSGTDAPQDCDAWSYAPSNFSPCEGKADAAVSLAGGDYTLDTATGELMRGGMPIATLPVVGSDPVVIPLVSLQIEDDATLRIVGSGPLVIAVHGSARIAGDVLVSAIGVAPGSGAASCMAMPGGNTLVTETKGGGGGGAGGAFGSGGAGGGEGDTEITAHTPGGAPSVPVGEPMLVPLRGGCGGGAGGDEHPNALSEATPGPGGGGGGAIQISVRDTLDLSDTGSIQANGGGGDGAANQLPVVAGLHIGAGGGGGGSGGAIFLEGSIVRIDAAARLCANGGGGGGGSHQEDAVGSGRDGVCAESAGGGGMGGNGGDGGAGSFAVTAAVVGLQGEGNDGGGGGGGGGVGRIRVRAIEAPAPSGFMSTPPAQP